MLKPAEQLETAAVALSLNEAINVMLAASMRCLRNKTTKEHLISRFPDLEVSSLTDASQLSESDRRMLLDLPDPADEEENIRLSTELTREELLIKALTSVETLTEQEMYLLDRHMWPGNTREEIRSRADASRQVQAPDYEHEDTWRVVDERLKRAREPAYKGKENQAFDSASKERSRRRMAEHYAWKRAREEKALAHARPWVHRMYNLQQSDSRMQAGFVCFYDSWLRKFDPQERENWGCRWAVPHYNALSAVGAQGSIKWGLQEHPAESKISLTRRREGHYDIQEFIAAAEVQEEAVTAMRAQFLTMCERPPEYSRPKGDKSTHGIEFGLLRNTFLVMDETCYISINVHTSAAWVDDMVILAVDPHFPEAGRAYPEGYKGHMWVRFAQICNRFFEMRWLHDAEYRMEHLWQVAQTSVRNAFPSEKNQFSRECRLYDAKVKLDLPFDEINRGCDNIKQLRGDYICVSFPGAVQQARESRASTTAAEAPVPVPTNIVQNINVHCSKYHETKTGDTCALITQRQRISLKDLRFLNPDLDTDCTNLMPGYSYCVKPVGNIKTYDGYRDRSAFPKDPCVGGLSKAHESCYATTWKTGPLWTWPTQHAATSRRSSTHTVTSATVAPTAANIPGRGTSRAPDAASRGSVTSTTTMISEQ